MKMIGRPAPVTSAVNARGRNPGRSTNGLSELEGRDGARPAASLDPAGAQPSPLAHIATAAAIATAARAPWRAPSDDRGGWPVAVRGRMASH
jgi:hypothetical protein